MSSFHFPTIDDYAQAYRSGATTPAAVADRFLAGWRASEHLAPPLAAFITVLERDVRAQAEASTRRFAEGRPLGPLDGVPIAVKDEMHQAGYPTSVGTAFLGTRAETTDATVVARLRAAGALLVGKTNMHESGFGGTGINPHHGAARNPYDARCITGGSSSGCGAVVGTGLAPVAIGADGGGSIRIPSALCGTAGIKATYGRVPETGAYPLVWSLAHIGPLATTLEDAWTVLAVIAGDDPADPNSLGHPPLEGLPDGDVSGVRLGWSPTFFDQADAEVADLCRERLDGLAARGATLVEVTIPHLELVAATGLVTMGCEMAASQHVNLRAFGHRYGSDVKLALEASSRLSAVDYLRAQQARTRIARGLAAVLESVDAIVSPAVGCVAPEIRADAEEVGEVDDELNRKLTAFTFIANLTGVPAISVPAGYGPGGLPVGLQVMAAPWREDVTVRVGRAVEGDVERQRPAIFYELLDAAPARSRERPRGARRRQAAS